MSFNTYQNGLGGDRGDGGFTMIELIIVVAVVGILGSIVIFAMSNKAAEALQSACAADADVVWTAQEARAIVEGSFAPDVASLVPDFLRSTPQHSNHYVITTDISGTVFVASAAGGPAEPMTSQPNPCASIT